MKAEEKETVGRGSKSICDCMRQRAEQPSFTQALTVHRCTEARMSSGVSFRIISLPNMKGSCLLVTGPVIPFLT